MCMSVLGEIMCLVKFLHLVVFSNVSWWFDSKYLCTILALLFRFSLSTDLLHKRVLCGHTLVWCFAFLFVIFCSLVYRFADYWSSTLASWRIWLYKVKYLVWKSPWDHASCTSRKFHATKVSEKSPTEMNWCRSVCFPCRWALFSYPLK